VLAPVLAIFIAHFYAGAFAARDSIVLAAVVSGLAVLGALIWKESAVVLGARSLWIAGVLLAVPLVVALIQTLTPGFDREYALMALLRLYGMGATFALGCLIGFDEQRLGRLRLWLCLATALFAGFCLIHFHLILTHALPLPLFQKEDRLFSTFFSANSAALELAIGLMATGAVAIAELRGGEADFAGRRRISLLGWLALAGAALSFVAIGLTRSRTGIVLTVGVPVLILLLSGKPTRRKMLMIGLPAAAAALLVIGLTLFTRFGEANEESLRPTIYQAHLGFALDRPLLGHGFGSFPALSRAVLNEANFTALHNVGAMHELYLEWLEQAGWIASAAMAACALWVLAKLFSQRSIGRRASVYWIRGALAALLIAFGQGLLDFGLEHYSTLLMLVLFAGSAFGLCQRRDVRMAAAERSTRAPSGRLDRAEPVVAS
jgi:O-antigen ligase